MRGRALIFAWAALYAAPSHVCAIPWYDVDALCSSGITSAKGFAVQPFQAPYAPGTIWIVTALHAVNGCSWIKVRRPGGAKTVVHNPEIAFAWPERDIVAFPVQATEAGLAGTELPGSIASVDPATLHHTELYVWTTGQLTPGARRTVFSQESAPVGEIRQKMMRSGLRGNLGSIGDDVYFLEYSADVGAGDSGAAVTVADRVDQIVAVHMAGTNRATVEGRNVCWAMVFTDAVTNAPRREVSFATLRLGLRGYNEPKLGQALHAIRIDRENEALLTRAKMIIWPSGGLAAVGVAGGIGFLLAGGDATSEFMTRCPTDACNRSMREDAVDRSHVRLYDTLQLISWVAAGVGLAGLATGTVYWLQRTDANADVTPNGEVQVSIEGLGLKVRGDF